MIVMFAVALSFVPQLGGLIVHSEVKCTDFDRATTGCPIVGAGIDGKDVVVKVDLNKPVAQSGDPRMGGSGSGSSDNAASPVIPAPPVAYLGRDGYTITGPVTLSDIARFRPDAGTDLMQPNGWMIVGLSTNFYAHADRHIKSGTLLGQPASVRFTPVRYSWAYGDGATRTTATPGATWSDLRINEFEATPTSHIYRAPGKYFIDLTIGYTPEYRYATGPDWIPVTGIVWVPANRLVAEASAGAKTVLVEHECTVNPSGPGC